MPLSIDHYLLFVSLVTLIVVTPGPNLFLLLAGGRTASGLSMTFGFCAAILSHAGLALLGVGAIIAASALLFTGLKVAGAAYLIWLGLRSLWSLRQPSTQPRVGRPAGDGKSLSQAFTRGYLTNLLNPKPAVFYVAAFPQFLDLHAPALFTTGLALALTHALIALLFYGTVALLVDRVARVLTRPRVARVVKSITASALILLGGKLLLARPPG